MFKRIGLIIGSLILSILLLGYVFRLPLLQWAIAPELKKVGVILSCLDFSITTKLNIHVQNMCLQYQGQQLTLKNITANTQQIIIEQAQLVTSTSSSSGNNSLAKPLNLALLDKRPLVSIKQLLLVNNQLSKELKLSISEPALNQFVIQGDIDATVRLQKNLVSGNFKINESHLKLIANNAFSAFQRITFDAQQQFNFDGINLDLKGDISAQYVDSYKQCQVQTHSQGKIAASVNLNSKAVTLDTQALNNNLTLAPHCTALIDSSKLAIEPLPLNWQLTLPANINLENNQLSLPAISITSEGDKHYKLSITDTRLDTTRPIQSIQSQITLQVSKSVNDNLKINTQLSGGNLQGDFALALKKLPRLTNINAKNIHINGEFAISNVIDDTPTAHVNAQLSAAEVDGFNASIVQYQAGITAKIDDKRNAEIALSHQFKSAQYKKYKLTGIHNTLTANAHLGAGEIFAKLAAKTSIKTINSPELQLKNIKVNSSGEQSRALQATHHAFVDGMELVVNHHFSSQAHPFEVIFPVQSILPLNSYINQFAPLATLTQGEFNGHIHGDINLQKASFKGEVSKLTALYNDYLASDFNSIFSGQYSSGQLNVEPTTFSINELRAGAVINNITGHWRLNDEVQIDDVKGHVFDGNFGIERYIVGQPNQIVDVEFYNIDASKLVTFNEQSGISVSGRLAGTLPVHFDKNQVSVLDGQLFSQGEGHLKITNNAAFEAVLEQQQALKPVLGLLKDLDIQNLKSSVALKNDGWLKLGVNLQGYNKQAKQQVNFNYNHEENVFTLLRALRLSDEITQKVEQQYLQKGNQ